MINIEKLKARLNQRIKHCEKALPGDMRHLSQILESKANQIERGQCVNGLGEIQSAGNIIDAKCGELNAFRQVFKIINEPEEISAL